MSYAPIEQVPLQDLSSPATPDSADESESSETSAIFEEIQDYAKFNQDAEIYEDDPNFQKQLRLFRNSGGISKRICSIVFLCCFAVWAVALMVYSNGNARRAASSLWQGPATNLVLLANRNISLNSYDAKFANVSMDANRKGQYWLSEVSIRWLLPSQFPKTATDSAKGFYLSREGGLYVVRQAHSTYSMTLLDSVQFEYLNTFFYAEDLQLNPGESIDNKDAWHLVRSDLTGQWRHSSFLLYWLWQPESGHILPVQPPGQNDDREVEKLHFAHFGPNGKYLVFGHNHDLYMMDVETQATTAIATDGSSDIFNGKPDWVYEEEIYPYDNMIWWSPDLKYLLYVSIDDSQVSEYKMEYYVKNANEVAMSYEDSGAEKVDEVNQYPIHSSIKYPKPGTKNPTVKLYLYEVELNQSTPVEGVADDLIGLDFIVYDVKWIDKDSALIKLSDRASTIQVKKVLSASESSTLKFVSSTNSTEYGGWIEKALPIVLVKQGDQSKYLDRIVVDNLVQLALFDLASAKEYSKLLGPVNYDANLAYDAAEDCVYGMFGTDLNSSFAAVSLTDSLKKIIATDGKYDPRFSADAQFVNLFYRGPAQPWQKVLNMALWHLDSTSLADIDPINDVKRLSQTLAQTNVPTKVYTTVKVGQGSDEVDLNMIEIFPPNFDPKGKYPLLVHAYGGPGSTTVDYSFLVSFQDIVSSELSAVVLIIEPRGTGSDNWHLKSFATKQLGFWEPRDISTIVKDYIKTNKYVNDKRTAIWGWSYGGFTTLKTLEFDQGEVFKYGMAVAPVTNWLFYDSMYTERYMKSPKGNPNYKAISRLNGFDNFKKVSRFLVMHGTADDNVHLQNSMWLLDNLDMKGVENYDVHFFPDSDHSIYYHNANSIVYDKLLWWLKKAFMGYYD